VLLLPGVLLRDLQLDRQPRGRHRREHRRDRLAGLEVDGAVLDLKDRVVAEPSVERGEVIVGCPGAIGRAVAPVLPMVVDERAPVHDAAVRSQRVGEHVGTVGVAAAVGERPRLPFRVSLDDVPAEVGDALVDAPRGIGPPSMDCRVQRIGGGQSAEDDRRGEANRQVHPDPVGTQLRGQRRDVVQTVGQQACLDSVHVDVVDRDRVDAGRGQQPAVRPDPGQVRSQSTVGPEQGAAGVPALDLSHDLVHGDVVPVVEHAQPCRGPVVLDRVIRAEGRLAEAQQMEEPVQQPGRAGGQHGRDAVPPDHREAFGV
jgi:hypothetical protein